MHRSAVLSGVLDHIKFIQNVVGDNRRKVKMNINKINNGGSHVIASNKVSAINRNKGSTNNVRRKLNENI